MKAFLYQELLANLLTYLKSECLTAKKKKHVNSSLQIKENVHMLPPYTLRQSNKKGIRTYPPVLQMNATYVLTNPPNDSDAH